MTEDRSETEGGDQSAESSEGGGGSERGASSDSGLADSWLSSEVSALDPEELRAHFEALAGFSFEVPERPEELLKFRDLDIDDVRGPLRSMIGAAFAPCRAVPLTNCEDSEIEGLIRCEEAEVSGADGARSHCRQLERAYELTEHQVLSEGKSVRTATAFVVGLNTDVTNKKYSSIDNPEEVHELEELHYSWTPGFFDDALPAESRIDLQNIHGNLGGQQVDIWAFALRGSEHNIYWRRVNYLSPDSVLRYSFSVNDYDGFMIMESGDDGVLLLHEGETCLARIDAETWEKLGDCESEG